MVDHVTKDVLQCLESYQWPGNVRELENLLMKCVALSPGDNITRDLLPDNIRCCSTEATARDSKEKPMDEWSLEEMEMAHVARVLNATHWHKGRACEILGVSRPRLRRMINQFQLVSPAGEIDEDEESTTISNA
ncbi:MAG: hypothetical protein DIZ77_12200 [endosymbiont of Seepiophila jonesi]|uniref:Sigma-54 factor interaction domain-containing protein n=1 Tax=endosymbiont of Lamellibrachia luymesi TaxID=2200907 RepID=A0A370E0W7_9GAMM|nr:MAG: hypothetical protein DIZ77_12200 [endosymbiont of Seepiophila jonesi]RDH92349.1 MAG: hypothetical protein DIZ79_03690 [endosymbiont of Lamellibrachia luymesi]